jgi:rhodanese-related sulfurtransferase
VRAGATLVDVRDPNEWALGTPPGVLRISLPVVAEQLPQRIADRDTEIVTICGSGKRSLRAVDALAAVGYTRVAS